MKKLQVGLVFVLTLIQNGQQSQGFISYVNERHQSRGLQSCSSNQNWIHSFRDTTVNSNGGQAAIDINDQIYFTVDYANTYGIVKMTQYGVVTWQKAYANNVKAADLKYTSQDSEALYITGDVLGASSLNVYGLVDLFLHKVNTLTGATSWLKVWGGTSNDQGRSVAITPDAQRIVVTGHQTSFLLPGSTMTESNLLLTFDNLGTLLTSRTYSGSYVSLQGRGLTFDSTGEFIFTSLTMIPFSQTNARLMFKKTSIITSTDSWVNSWGSNTGMFYGKRSIVITKDDTSIIMQVDSANTDFNPVASGTKTITLIVSADTTAGTINWANSIAFTDELKVYDGALSPDSTQYYFVSYFYQDATTSHPAFGRIKVSDGSIQRYVEVGSGVIVPTGMAVSPVTNRITVIGTASSGTFKQGSNNNVFVMNWHQIWQDATCTAYGFTTKTSYNYKINTVLTVQAESITKYPINQVAVDKTAMVSSSTTTATNTDMAATATCTSQLIVPSYQLSPYVGSVGATVNLLYPAFCTPVSPQTFTYTATLLDGTALPSWLTFSAATRQFSGTPIVAGTYYITVRGTLDTTVHYTGSTFEMIIQNNPPVVIYPISNQGFRAGISFSFTFDSSTFMDPNGDTITYSAMLTSGSPLPNYIQFATTKRQFSGIAPGAGSLSIQVKATDTYQNSVTLGFTITFTNTAPAMPTKVPNMGVNTYENWVYRIPSTYYTDADGHKLKLTAFQAGLSYLPAWLQFNEASWTFIGQPTYLDVGSVDIQINLDDNYGGTNYQTFTLTVNAKPKLKTVAIPLTYFKYAQGTNTIALSSYFEDTPLDTLTYAVTRANGNLPGSWLSVSGTGVMTIVATIANVGLNHLTCKVTDSKGQSISKSFDILINSPPTINTVQGSMYATQNQQFAYTLPTTLFVDADLNPITVSVLLTGSLPLPGWLKYDPTLQLLYGTPSASDVGTLSLAIQATDSYNENSSIQTVTLSVLSNNAPTLRPTYTMRDQTIKSYQDFSFQIPDELFLDIDSESLVLNLQQASGADVPPWIKFTPQNRLVYGNAATTLTVLPLKLIATDPKRAAVSTLFNLYISRNNVPTVIEAIDVIDVQFDTFFVFQVPDTIFRDTDGDTLTYSLENFDEQNVIPTWLTFIAGNRTLLGYPKETHAQLFKFKYVVKDGRQGTTYQMVYINVKANFELGKILPLAVIGLLPLLGIFIFVFAMAFMKVPVNNLNQLLKGKAMDEVDYDTLKRALDEQQEYKDKQKLLKQ